MVAFFYRSTVFRAGNASFTQLRKFRRRGCSIGSKDFNAGLPANVQDQSAVDHQVASPFEFRGTPSTRLFFFYLLIDVLFLFFFHPVVTHMPSDFVDSLDIPLSRVAAQQFFCVARNFCRGPMHGVSRRRRIKIFLRRKVEREERPVSSFGNGESREKRRTRPDEKKSERDKFLMNAGKA